MFDHFAYSVLVAPALVLLGAWLLADRLKPAVAVKVFAWSAVTAAACATVNVLAFVLKAVSELSAVAAWGGWSAEVVKADTAHVPWATGLSVVWFAVSSVAVLVGWRRYRASLRAAWEEIDHIEGHLEPGDLEPADADVVVLPDDRVDAFALPGKSGDEGRVVVTTGLRDALAAPQFAAVLAHERAHLDGGHHQLVWFTRLSAYANPLLWPLVRRVSYLVERAADEEAARATGSRGDVARAIAHAALAVKETGAGPRPPGLLAMSSPPGVVPRRMAAMTGPEVRRRWLLGVPVVLAASTIVWTGECAYDLYELLAYSSDEND
ncbi:M48 family metalloprotease [Actinocorallia sp. A-T 12471]|uniref:M48 family metalloprotease n=1 Tax=Actinocorallia sp. A-T 12471 TaxID=3089813 RepID=UPI0029CE73ED|nr:M48 family metalloprotease [Actinocorallia sp. A-T 12471]MDX6744049.1 M48 family metalloprotease [Actinocorallia sp. A-T 12471]